MLEELGAGRIHQRQVHGSNQMEQHVAHTQAQAFEGVGGGGGGQPGLKVWLAEGEEFAHGELRADKVAADKEAVGQHLQQAGPCAEGRLLLVFGEDRRALHLATPSVVAVKRQP